MSDAGRGEVFTSKSDETIMREAELMALRQMADSVSTMTRELVTHREVMTELRVDMAAIKERQAQHSEFKEFLLELKQLQQNLTERVDLIETRNAKQDGAMGFAHWIKEFGPWLLMVAGGAWAYLRVTRS